MPVQSGLSAAVELVVTEADTAVALRSGSVPVLGTPRIVALCEEASCLAVGSRLAEGETTVGLRVELTHLAPTKVGSKVRAEATLERTEGRRLTFTLSVSDDCGLIAAGKLTRVVVDVATFLDKAR
ncbi:MAG: fluoroacetyl-CoA thioesterase [Acidimicrobiaceae bacterium]|nr:fluoroacetyl-CoA thioesterase [Acidimicrobiaceae bacterium]